MNKNLALITESKKLNILYSLANLRKLLKNSR